jgi:glycosyltransferase involved in cell wall biosynthesis
VPEVIEDGISGYIVSTEEEALAAIYRIPDLDRHRVRSAYERRFTAARMARAYVDVYAELVQHSAGRSVTASRAT